MLSENEVHKPPSETIYVQAIPQVTVRISCSDGYTYRYEMKDFGSSARAPVDFTEEGYGLIQIHTPSAAQRILLKVCNKCLCFAFEL